MILGDIQKFSNLFSNSNIDLGFTKKDKCAVVGNGGILYESKMGSLVDDHDVVVRMNCAKVDGYEEDVGFKTTFRILNGPILKGESQDPMGLEENWIDQVSAENIIFGRTTQEGKLNGINTLINHNDLYFPSDQVLNKVEEFEEEFNLCHMSTGLFSVIMFLTFFDKVSIFGFGFHQERLEKRHYWEPYTEEHSVNHEWDKEEDLMLLLEKQDFIQRFN